MVPGRHHLQRDIGAAEQRQEQSLLIQLSS